MLKRVLVGAALAVILLASGAALAQGGGDPARGAALWAENCLACHGPLGEARATHPAFASTVEFNTSFVPTTQRGVSGTYMGPWGQAHGGPLTDQEIDDLLAYAQTWASGDTPPLPEVDAEAGEGAALYAVNCAGCHGDQGQGRGLNLYTPIDNDGDSTVAVRRGVSNTLMPPFAQDYGGPLTGEEIVSVVSYAGTLEGPAAAQTGAQPIPQGAGTLILLIGLGAISLVGLAVLTQRSAEAQSEG